MLVRETISFERKRDPKKALGLNDLIDLDMPYETMQFLQSFLKNQKDIIVGEIKEIDKVFYLPFWKNGKKMHISTNEFAISPAFISTERVIAYVEPRIYRKLFTNIEELIDILKRRKVLNAS